MIERKQPICLGRDKRGELIWGEIPMPDWQVRLIQSLVPIPYVGDFLAFWLKHAFFHKTGYESDEPTPNMELRSGHYKSKTPRRHHSGD